MYDETKHNRMKLVIWPVSEEEYDQYINGMALVLGAQKKHFHATWMPEGVG